MSSPNRILFCWFPRLRHDPLFRVVDADPGCPLETYNCVAYAVGDPGRFWGTRADEYWPAALDRRPDFLQHLDAYLELFEHLGYRRCSEPFDFRPEHAIPQPGVEKVALYVRREQGRDGPYLQCPHVARQFASGRWSSKARELEIFEHSLWALESEPADESNDAGGPPDECLEKHPSGLVFGHPPQNYGQVALVVRRDANAGPKGFTA